jgi:hypothetical protein
MSRISRIAVLIIIAVQSFTLARAQESHPESMEAQNDLPAGALTLGVRGGESFSEEQLDVLVPFYAYGGAGLWFINPRATGTNMEEEEFNLGVGYRHLFLDHNLIVGGNLYYDSRWPESGAQFDQMGFGIECLSLWVDARANYYLPEDKKELVDSSDERTLVDTSSRTTYEQWADENTIYERRRTTTTQTFLNQHTDVYEGTLEGWDAEIGVRVPMPWETIETRIFGGYYSFDPNIEVDRIEGWKARIEVRALPALLVDAEIFEDDALYGVDYLAGLRLRVPFNIGNAFRAKTHSKASGTPSHPGHQTSADA